MKKRMICLLLLFCLIPLLAAAEEPVHFFDDVERDAVGEITKTYDSPTLKYTIEKFRMHGELCRLVRLWVQDPARQILRETATWRKNLKFPKTLADRIPGAALVINGSGYVSPQFPEIPDNYPGESKDYFFTPLGSLSILNGEVLRNLEGVPYYGLTLDADGLQMYTGEDNETVLATDPSQAWSFYETCPLLRNNEDLLPEEWAFADRRAARTIIARLDKHNYLILAVDISLKNGISLRRAQEFFRESFPDAEWVYNLDGGPSSALLIRDRKAEKVHAIMGGGAKDFDIMAFIE